MVQWMILNISGAAGLPNSIEPAAEDGTSNCQHLWVAKTHSPPKPLIFLID
jgi:hypothetical protein